MDPDTLDNLLHALLAQPAQLTDLQHYAQDTSAALGLLHNNRDPPDTFKPIPLTLLPTLLYQPAAAVIRHLQGDINLLVHRVSLDRAFLTGILAGAAEVDDFTRRLLDIYAGVALHEQWQLGLLRSDYLSHCDQQWSSPKDTLRNATYKMVEINTICAGMQGLASHTPEIHRKLLQVMQIPYNQVSLCAAGESTRLHGRGLATAHAVYCQLYPQLEEERRVMLIVVVEGFEFNVLEHRLLENAAGVWTLRRSFRQIRQSVRVSAEGALLVEELEVAVVYYRTGYSPEQYSGEEDWNLRQLIEHSRSVKCPSVGYQLAGTKKVQQALSQPHVLQTYLPTSHEQLGRTFVGQFDLGDAEAVDRALSSPGDYILKPNREGGGNNLYDADLVGKVHEIRHTKQASSFILMEKIRAPTQRNILIRPGRQPELTETINEVSVFGTMLAKGDKIAVNESGSQISVRSKVTHVNEGSIAFGSACFSSSYLVS